MRDMVLYPCADVPAGVTALTGTVRPERASQPVVMDDVTSYRIDAECGEMRLSSGNMTRLMNRHPLPGVRTPIRDATIAWGDGTVTMGGTMQKLGVPVPFTSTATLAPTRSGDLRVHVISMRAAGLVPKGLVDALGLALSNIAQPANEGVFHIEGDDMIAPVLSMFPPPRFAGRITGVQVTRAGLAVQVGRKVPPPPGIPAGSYIRFRSLRLAFARLTMHDTDLTVVSTDGARPLAFSPGRYYAQLESGYTASLPEYGLAAHVRDFRELTPAPR